MCFRSVPARAVLWGNPWGSTATIWPVTEPAVPHTGVLTFGDIMNASGAPDSGSIVAIRHVFRPDDTMGLSSVADATPERVLEYTAGQLRKNVRFAKASLWLVFIADGGNRARFSAAYDNRGEVVDASTPDHVVFDLAESGFLSTLRSRLVVEWSNPVAWSMRGDKAARLEVTEISDPKAVPFPGFDRVLLSYAGLQAVVSDHRYEEWQTALKHVQAIYLIADTSTGKQYVGQAAGGENLLGRWSDYAATGHGGNVELRRLLQQDPDHAQHFIYSILRVFGPTTPAEEVYAAESHFMSAMLTRRFGLNR